MRRAGRARASQQGFALVELLTAIAVLSLLAAVAVVLLGAIRERAQGQACEADKRVLQSAVQSYHVRTGFYPANQGILMGVFLDEPSSMWQYDAPVDLRSGEPSYVPTAECQ